MKTCKMCLDIRFVLLALCGLGVATVASAQVTGIVNGDFEAQTLGLGSDTQDITGWYDSMGNYNDWLYHSPSEFSSLDSTNILGFSSAAGYVYQQIGTNLADYSVVISGTVLQRSGESNQGFRLELLAGDFPSAADGTPLTATLLDTVIFDRSTLTNAPYNFSDGTKDAADFLATLNTGSSGVVGSQLWLRISAYNISGQELFLDNLAASATPVPEPATYATVAGAAMLAFACYRRRSRQPEQRASA